MTRTQKGQTSLLRDVPPTIKDTILWLHKRVSFFLKKRVWVGPKKKHKKPSIEKPKKEWDVIYKKNKNKIKNILNKGLGYTR